METNRLKVVNINVPENAPYLSDAIEGKLNPLLECGYEVCGSPVVVDSFLVYHLIKPKPKDYVRMETAWPSKKQLGYICWAYQVNDQIVESSKVSRQMASFLISFHSENHSGMAVSSKLFRKKVAEFNAMSPEQQKAVLRRKEDDPPKASTPAADNDLPFDDDDVPF